MTILFYIAMAILVLAVLAAVFTDIHPTAFYVSWLVSLGLLAVGDAWRSAWWAIAFDVALAVFASWGWRKELQKRRARA